MNILEFAIVLLFIGLCIIFGSIALAFFCNMGLIKECSEIALMI